MVRKILILLLATIGPVISYSQGEWNNWYFGKHAGLSFNSGNPLPLGFGATNTVTGCASISDSLGNLLFYTDGKNVYNKLNLVTANGSDLYGSGTQGTLILPLPSNNNKYYIITVYGVTHNITSIPGTGLHYSVFDLTLFGGLGDIVPGQKNIPLYLPLGDFAADKLTAVRHKNNRDIWIIARSLSDNYFYSYLLTISGIDPIAKISFSLVNLNIWDLNRGEIAVSPDGTKMCTAYAEGINGFEFGNFNTKTGQYTSLFLITPSPNPSNSVDPLGLEFSPDSKLLYCTFPHTDFEHTPIYQYDAQLNDSALFRESEKLIGHGIGSVLQTGPDNQIYGGILGHNKLSVIKNPNERIFFDYEYESIILNEGASMGLSLPQMVQKYFAYFTPQHLCANQPVEITSNIWPLPDSVYWNFGDATSGSMDTSTLINPDHVYNAPGNYLVTLIAYWPGDRSDTTIKNIVITHPPDPALGLDEEICIDGSTTLSSAPFESYLWITGEITQSIPVADTGLYWVEVTNADGCIGRDSVQVSWFPQPTLNETNLIISPTTCGGSNGAIRGLTVSGTEPIALEWKNNAGNVLSSEEDIFNLPVGNYYLWATDGNGCNNLVSQYTISDAGDVLIASVSHSDSYCGQNNGSITITAVSGLSDMLEYSIDNGTTWYSNEGLFGGLTPGLDYDVRVRVPDGSGCEAVYAFNPVMIDDFSGPQVIASAEPATGSNANGSITLSASGFGNLAFSLNGGTPQTSNEFTGLIAGTYTWRVEDENGCFTEGSIDVGQEAGFTISAIAGNSAVCLGNAPIAPLLIENFTGVQAFTATLEYDATLVNCEGFRPGSVHPLLEANLIAEVYPASQRIVVTWSGSAPLTLTGTVTVLDLAFSATQAGNSFLTWDQAPAATWFTGEYGSIEPEFQIGQIQVNNPPVLAQQFPVNVCEGELAWLTAPGSGNEPLTYQWTLPDGSTSQNSSLMFFDASTTHSGQYRVKVSDALGCSDSTLLTLQVTPNPRDWFLQDTILFENQYLLAGPAGYASYRWSTGDTMPEITVNTEGLYTLQLTTHNLCAGADSTYLKMLEAESPFLVPNAFTPNGDGLNDTFRPVATGDLIRQFSMVIYNRWGQKVFETSDPSIGWDGEDAPAGVYSWVISFSDMVGKVAKIKGSVTLVR